MDYGLKQNKLYRIPESAVSYHPDLANGLVWWTGEYFVLPVGGGTMARFIRCDTGETVGLRPFAVVEA